MLVWRRLHGNGAALAYSADYPDAHLRHWADAELLLQAGRWANADQLYGFSAECGLKAVMVANGMPVDSQGAPAERRHKQHIQVLWDQFLAFAAGRSIANLLHHLPQRNPFAKWSQDNRYASSGHFDRATVAPHRTAARQVRQFYLRHKAAGYV